MSIWHVHIYSNTNQCILSAIHLQVWSLLSLFTAVAMGLEKRLSLSLSLSVSDVHISFPLLFLLYYAVFRERQKQTQNHRQGSTNTKPNQEWKFCSCLSCIPPFLPLSSLFYHSDINSLILSTWSSTNSPFPNHTHPHICIQRRYKRILVWKNKTLIFWWCCSPCPHKHRHYTNIPITNAITNPAIPSGLNSVLLSSNVRIVFVEY